MKKVNLRYCDYPSVDEGNIAFARGMCEMAIEECGGAIAKTTKVKKIGEFGFDFDVKKLDIDKFKKYIKDVKPEDGYDWKWTDSWRVELEGEEIDVNEEEDEEDEKWLVAVYVKGKIKGILAFDDWNIPVNERWWDESKHIEVAKDVEVTIDNVEDYL